MSAECFLDTNILVYSFDADNLAKPSNPEGSWMFFPTHRIRGRSCLPWKSPGMFMRCLVNFGDRICV